MDTAVLDATDMGTIPDASFDVVLNMGPFYHLIAEEQRKKCLSESVRVLKKGGLLATAYIPRYFLFQYISTKDSQYLDEVLSKQLIQTGILRHDDEKCFWTDSYYATKEEMELLYPDYHLNIVDHFAQDGIAPFLADKIDAWDESQFEKWCNHHYSICREPSLLGVSNHVVIVGKKVDGNA